MVTSASARAIGVGTAVGCLLAGAVVVGPVCGTTLAADVILNEYNAVGDASLLEGSGEDAYWGRREANGGDWFELVVITDHLDLRGWDLVLTNATGDPVNEETFVLTLTNDLLWSDLRSGTILTVSEDLANNVDDYLPELGRWWINVKAAESTLGTYITASNFKVSNSDWQLTILDELDQVVFGPAGEGIQPPSGVGNDEVCKLEAHPSAAITPTANYNDGSSSTFGSPNQWNGGADEQDFAALRSVVPYAPLTSVRVNELNAHTDPPDEDWIELYNTTASSVEVGGWYLSDAAADLTRFEIPPGTQISGGGFLMFTESELPFALSSEGEELYLSEADGLGNMTGRRDAIRFGAVENGVTVGRFPDGTGPSSRLIAGTPGGPNTGPIIGPVVINEIMYHPAPPVTPPASGLVAEFIELYNHTTAPLDLYRDFGPEGIHSWRITGGVDFEFPLDTTLPGRSYLLVVNFDPVAEPEKLNDFLDIYGLDESIAILGPYSGGLGDFSDAVRLRMPDTPNDLNEVPLITIDEVTYFDFGAWPAAADGGGPSLERFDPRARGDDPANWSASLSPGGTPGRVNTATLTRVPTMSQWGIMVMAGTVATAGTLLIRAPRRMTRSR